jgi:hypothetical protein
MGRTVGGTSTGALEEPKIVIGKRSTSLGYAWVTITMHGHGTGGIVTTSDV